MKSWAVTRGPSLDPADKRLAVHVEDHPVEYNTFEGTIPDGEYGGGTVMIWDRGTWHPEGDPHKGYAKGHLVFDLDGEKLHGRWHLVRMHGRPNQRHDNWLLIKAKDGEARSARQEDIMAEAPNSAASGRTMEEIAGRQRQETGLAQQPRRQWRGRSATVAKVVQGGAARVESKVERTGKSSAQDRVISVAREVACESQEESEFARPRADGDAKTSKRARLPDFVPPSLATFARRAAERRAWLHEVKFDGYRIEARLDRGEVTLLTRNRQDWTHRFKAIAAAVAKLKAVSALLDGELVVEDQNGVSSFSLLQTDLKAGRSDGFVYNVFDLLYLDGRDLTELPLIERKAELQRLLPAKGDDPIRYVEHFDGDGRAIFEQAEKLNLEGIISKLRDAPYRSGRTENFVKIKTHDEQEFVVAGFSPSAAMPRAIGALTVAFHDGGELRYAGRVGTGYTREVAHDLWQRLDKLRTERPALAVPQTERRKDVIWVKPDVVIEAEYRGITHDGLLRQAAYKGLREDKPARDVVRERPIAAAAAATRGQAIRRSGGAATAKGRQPAGAQRGDTVADVRLTHPDRVYWPDNGVTKKQLAEYYASVWDWIKPRILGRALSLVRAPGGIKGETFFQKHIAANVKGSPLRHTVPGKDHDVIAVENLADLIALVQSGALEIHVRGSRLDSLETCDRIVFDLDPGEGVSWKDIIAAARETRERLKDLKLDSFVKLSGGKGIHVVLPIADADWDMAKDFAQKIAFAMAADSPRLYLAKMTKSLRKGRIFIDYFRNSREATSVAAYSSRARPGAPVSAPVTWEQLSRTAGANQYTVLNLKKQFRQDSWRDIGKVRQKLPK